MIKKVIIIILLVAVAITATYFVYKNLTNKTDVSRLGSETINGQIYRTSGSIPFENTDARNLLSQVVRLADLGDITRQGFRISVDNNSKVNILLYSPYDANKQSALSWLKDNGFNLITETIVVFTNTVNSPQ